MKIAIKLFLVTSLLFVSCNNSNPTEIYNKYKNSVVLIYSEYYYKITLDNGSMLYSSNNEDGVLEILFSEEEAINNPNATTGTGFFISEKGEIATNRHVVEHIKNEVEVYNSLYELKSLLSHYLEDLREQKEEIKNTYNENYSILTYDEKEKLKEKYQEKLDEINDIENSISFDVNKSKIDVIDNYLGIAFSGEKISSTKEFHKCKKLKISDDEQVDIAIIQLESNITPETINDYFNIKSVINYNIDPGINDNISIIGFNSGFTLAQTENGIKSQFTEGKITQEPQSKKILYSVPILGGSSGSPVIDANGNILAINFAKYRDTQGFNFGVPVRNLLKLYYGDEIPEIQTTSSFNSNNIKFAYKFKNYFNNK